MIHQVPLSPSQQYFILIGRDRLPPSPHTHCTLPCPPPSVIRYFDHPLQCALIHHKILFFYYYFSISFSLKDTIF
jgi:hypothetical protein